MEVDTKLCKSLESKFEDWGGSVDLLSLTELVPRPLEYALSSLH